MIIVLLFFKLETTATAVYQCNLKRPNLSTFFGKSSIITGLSVRKVTKMVSFEEYKVHRRDNDLFFTLLSPLVLLLYGSLWDHNHSFYSLVLLISHPSFRPWSRWGILLSCSSILFIAPSVLLLTSISGYHHVYLSVPLLLPYCPGHLCVQWTSPRPNNN